MMSWPKTAAVFPGQGSQVLGMGKDFAEEYQIARETFAQADDLLGFALSDICWNGPEDRLNQTVNTQPALFVCSLAIWRVLQQRIPECQPTWMAGHSLGEFSALTAAGALSFEDGLRLVRTRGELMQQAGEESPGAMAAVLGLQAQTVETLCATVSRQTGQTVVLANDNCPGQAVVSGDEAAVDRTLALAKESGVRRAVKLAVSVAAHSPLMASASADFNRAIETTEYHLPKAQLVGNVSAGALDSVDDIRQELNQQLIQAVRWTDSVQALIARGAETFVEIGAGSVLSGLIRRIDRKTARFSLNSVVALETFLESLSMGPGGE